MLLIRGYQLGISRYTPPACRYYPCCSQYGYDAIRIHGAFKGTLLTIWRLLRCNPFSHGGVDHVPAPGMWSNPRHRGDD
nr:membrane protein insertion efficiency factor YidD [Devriesea agamarum]